MTIRTIMALALGFLLFLPLTVDAAKGGRRSTAQILTLTNDDDCIFAINTISGSGAITLAGDCVSGTVATITATPLTKVGQQISILSAGNDNGINFTTCGTDADNQTRTTCEVITGGSGSTVDSVEYYTTITSITTSGASAGNVTIGWLSANGGVTDTLVPDLQGYTGVTLITVDVTGSVPYSVENTAQNMPSKIEPLWFNTLDLTTKTADAQGNFGMGVGGVRLKCTSAVCVANLMIFQGKLGRR